MTDIIVIGAGTAGMTSALYALRSGKSVLVLESETFGGQISFSPRVENFPSIKRIEGSVFSDNLLDQILELGASVELEEVLNIEKIGNNFKVVTNYNTYEAKSVIISVGVKHRHLHLAREDELVGKGISYCAVCDGAFYKGEEVVLIGDGNTALQYSLLLSNYCPKIYVCTLFDKFFGDDSLVNALRKKENIEVISNVAAKTFLGDSELSGIEFERKDKTTFILNSRACFVAIGQVPDNKIFENLVELDKEGYIKSDESCVTKTEGLYVAGDCRTKLIRQLTTAVADGAIAGIAACSYADRNK
jgi:thioredoxin reductase (NADPH)